MKMVTCHCCDSSGAITVLGNKHLLKKTIKRLWKLQKIISGPQGCQIYKHKKRVFCGWYWCVCHCVSENIITWLLDILSYIFWWFSSEYKNHNILGFTSLEMWKEGRCENKDTVIIKMTGKCFFNGKYNRILEHISHWQWGSIATVLTNGMYWSNPGFGSVSVSQRGSLSFNPTHPDLFSTLSSLLQLSV